MHDITNKKVVDIKNWDPILHTLSYNYKEKLILQLIGIIDIKVRKQWWSPTPEDILVGI